MKLDCNFNERNDLKTFQINFGVKDKMRRLVGAQVQVYTRKYWRHTDPNARMWHTAGRFNKPGIYFIAHVQQTRDGATWGAWQPENLFETSEDRGAYLDKRLKTMAKRALKNHG